MNTVLTLTHNSIKRNIMKNEKCINVCMEVSHWRACRWRDENTVLSKDGKYILCHSQSKKHECVSLFRLGENEIK